MFNDNIQYQCENKYQSPFNLYEMLSKIYIIYLELRLKKKKSYLNIFL